MLVQPWSYLSLIIQNSLIVGLVFSDPRDHFCWHLWCLLQELLLKMFSVYFHSCTCEEGFISVTFYMIHVTHMRVSYCLFMHTTLQKCLHVCSIGKQFQVNVLFPKAHQHCQEHSKTISIHKTHSSTWQSDIIQIAKDNSVFPLCSYRTAAAPLFPFLCLFLLLWQFNCTHNGIFCRICVVGMYSVIVAFWRSKVPKHLTYWGETDKIINRPMNCRMYFP